MKMNLAKRSLAVLLALLMILVSVPVVTAAESDNSVVPGSILVSVQTGSPRSISGARNTVKTALADFEIESIGMLASTKTYIVFQVVLADKSEAQVNLAVSALDEIDGVNYAKADDNEYWFCETDDFEPGSIIVTGSVGNLLADFEIESTRLLTPGSNRAVYCIYFKEKTKEIVWKALEILENSPSVKYAEPNYVCSADVEPDDPTEPPTQPDPFNVLKGDADGDGYVSVSDATTIQRYLVGFYDLDDEQVLSADTDGDGYVSISDVTMIQRYLVGLVKNW